MQKANMSFLKIKDQYLNFIKQQEVMGEPFQDKIGQLNNFYIPISDFIYKKHKKNKKTLIIGLAGGQGSGKSTIAKMITGLVRPTAGEIEYNNFSLYNSKRKYQIKKSRGQIQMIFQDPYSSLNPRFKVKDIIAEPLKFLQKNISRHDLNQSVFDLIDIVGMTRQSLDRYPHEFSGGQRQRISIARALATRPRLLICDEPTSALDVSIQAQILNLLKDIQDELHLTMLFISHDLPVIRQMCNRIIVLKNGIVCETNETETLFNDPKHTYTKELIRLMPKIESII